MESVGRVVTACLLGRYRHPWDHKGGVEAILRIQVGVDKDKRMDVVEIPHSSSEGNRMSYVRPLLGPMALRQLYESRVARITVFMTRSNLITP